MVMIARIEANRLNAKKSTGPRTPTGKARSAQNARAHGLRTPVMSDPQWRSLFMELRSQLMAHASEPSQFSNTDALALAMTDLKRIADARHTTLANTLQAFADGASLDGAACLAHLETLERYNRQAHFRLAKCLEFYAPGRGAPPSRKQALPNYRLTSSSNFDRSRASSGLTTKGRAQ